MNNKGQVLVLFILIIPLLLGIMTLVIDIGRAYYESISLNNKIELVIEYGLEDNLELEELKELTSYNLGDVDYEVNLNDGVIEISANAYVEGIISNILNIKGFEIKSKYQGFMDEERIKIEKVK